MWKLNNRFQRVKEEIKREVRKLFEWIKQEHNISNLWDAANEGLRGKFIAVNVYVKKGFKSII